MESVIATNVPTPDSDSSSLEKPTPIPAVLKNRLWFQQFWKTDSDSNSFENRLRLQLKACDSTDSQLRLHNLDNLAKIGLARLRH